MTGHILEKYSYRGSSSVESQEFTVLRVYLNESSIISVNECDGKVIKFSACIRVWDNFVGRKVAMTGLLIVLNILKFGRITYIEIVFINCNRFFGLITQAGFSSHYNITVIYVVDPNFLIELFHGIKEKDGPDKDENDGADNTTPSSIPLPPIW